MPIRKINDDEFEETSEAKKRRLKLSVLRAELQDNRQKISDINKRINHFKAILTESKYPEDVRIFLEILKNKKEMYTDEIPEQEALIAKLEKIKLWQ